MGGHTLPKVTLQELLKTCLAEVLAGYEKLCEEKQEKVHDYGFIAPPSSGTHGPVQGFTRKSLLPAEQGIAEEPEVLLGEAQKI